ncbi:hypothetical protein V1478_002725, partial [Vespula squamosa]
MCSREVAVYILIRFVTFLIPQSTMTLRPTSAIVKFYCIWSDPCYLKTCPNHDEKDLADQHWVGPYCRISTSDAFDSNALKHDGLRYREDDYRINRRSNK